MVRPRKIRDIYYRPEVTYFKPVGVPLRVLEEVELTFDELEAIRLVDLEDSGQSVAGDKMNISQSTLSRLLKQGRKKLAVAIINGKAIKINGGAFKMKNNFGKGRGLGPGAQRNFCVCPNCGHQETHIRGQPCTTRKCPECNTVLIGKLE